MLFTLSKKSGLTKASGGQLIPADVSLLSTSNMMMSYLPATITDGKIPHAGGRYISTDVETWDHLCVIFTEQHVG